jgi:hypothetical protein
MAAAGLEVLLVILVVILFVEINQSGSCDCLSSEVINSPLLDKTAVTGSALKTLRHELCMSRLFFSLQTE